MIRLVMEFTYDDIRHKWAETCRSLGDGYVQGVSATFDSDDQATPGEFVNLGSSEKSKNGSLFREIEEVSGGRVLGRGGNSKRR